MAFPSSLHPHCPIQSTLHLPPPLRLPLPLINSSGCFHSHLLLRLQFPLASCLLRSAPILSRRVNFELCRRGSGEDMLARTVHARQFSGRMDWGRIFCLPFVLARSGHLHYKLLYVTLITHATQGNNPSRVGITAAAAGGRAAETFIILPTTCTGCRRRRRRRSRSSDSFGGGGRTTIVSLPSSFVPSFVSALKSERSRPLPWLDHDCDCGGCRRRGRTCSLERMNEAT